MELDLVVRNGLVIDGSGSPGARADVAVAGGRIVAVGEVDGTGKEEIDADGLVVSPGFVDGHTHMDAQVHWNDLGASSCYHGVTSVVMGNCGYTLAPGRPEDRPLLVKNIERAEDIPAEAMEQGITWGWETFAEYMDVVDALPKGLNYAQAVGHSALRIWAMGAKAFEAPSTSSELDVMKQELSNALRAGAVGLTTSRSKSHFTSDDLPVASRLADWSEVDALVSVVGRESDGGFQWGGYEEGLDFDAQFGRLAQLSLDHGVPVMLSAPRLEVARAIGDAVARGGEMYGWTHCRGVCTLQSFETRLSFDMLPEWQEIRRLPDAEQRKALVDPEVRARLVHAAHTGEYRPVAAADPFKPDYDQIYIMFSPYLANPTVAEEARRRGVDPVEVMIDVSLENDMKMFFMQLFAPPQADEDMVQVLRSPNTAMTFTDAGAHVSQVADISLQTHLLAYWVRERQLIPLEEAIRSITHQPAKAWRLHDRGLLAPGFAADITIFDRDTVAPLTPTVVDDIPGGVRRLDQRAVGYAATIVNGQVLTRDGVATEARPGQLLRAGRIPVPR